MKPLNVVDIVSAITFWFNDHEDLEYDFLVENMILNEFREEAGIIRLSG